MIKAIVTQLNNLSLKLRMHAKYFVHILSSSPNIVESLRAVMPFKNSSRVSSTAG